MSALTRIVTAAAVTWGSIYLVWRLLATADGADGVAFAVLFGAETLGLAVFWVRSWHAWPAPSHDRPRPVAPGTTVLIDGTGASVADLRTTLVAVRAMNGRPLAVVVDERGNRWLRSVAERLDALVLDRRLDLEAAFHGVATDWVLHLRPGDVPADDLIERIARECRPDADVIQLPVREIDRGPLTDASAGPGAVDAFDQQVMRPALSARMSVPWYGDTPALIRRSSVVPAAAALGPAAQGTIDEADRWWRTGIELTGAGGRIAAAPDVLVEVPPALTGEDRRRIDRALARRRLRSLTASGRRRRPSPRMALAHAAPIVTRPMAASARVLQVAALIIVLGLVQVPIGAEAIELLAYAGPAYGLRWSAHLLLGRGRLAPLTLLRQELRWLGPMVLGVSVFSVVVSMAMTVVGIWQEWDGRLPETVAAGALVAGVGFVGVAAMLLVEHHTDHQRRVDRRVRLGMVTCRLEDHDGLLVDISSGGVSVALPGASVGDLTPGTFTTLGFRIPVRDGRWQAVSAVVHVVRVIDDVQGGVRIGLEFDDPTAAPLDAVAEFLVNGTSGRSARHPTTAPRTRER